MPAIDRRALLASGLAGLAPAIVRAAAIDADRRTGTIRDVRHVVILMQENRSFDHYFGTRAGVRGFGDRFPIPVAAGPKGPARTVWTQEGSNGPVAPFLLDTQARFELMRVEGTPHTWPDTQAAWDEGRMARWPVSKTEHALGHYAAEDLPFQFALADAFTLCDAYHCSVLTGTNTNRTMLWTGTNDPHAKAGGPAIGNSHDSFPSAGGAKDDYTWTTYPERLQAAGIDWRIYQDMADNFSDNPLAGFGAYRQAFAGAPGFSAELKARAVSTRTLADLKADVLAGRLPQVSWLISGAKDSEHPGPSSPPQGADYVARALDALTADPKVWSRTVLLVMFDENDGFFDHMPPPAAPSRDPDRPGAFLGGSTVDTAGEYHLHAAPGEAKSDPPAYVGRPYGLGPRVPLYAISPWSRGGWINSQVFDHTSVIRFLEARFGVMEPNISPWRRAVCGDLTSCFDFRAPNRARSLPLPATAATAAKAAALPKRTLPTTPAPTAPVQAHGVCPSRALPYALEVEGVERDGQLHLAFQNQGKAGAVFHLYDRLNLARAPRRYTVEPGKRLEDAVPASGPYDLWILAPNGFHRAFLGDGATGWSAGVRAMGGRLTLILRNPAAGTPWRVAAAANAYADHHPAWSATVTPGGEAVHAWALGPTHGWYDLTLSSPDAPAWRRRFAGRLESGRDSITDPAMGGPALMLYPV